MKPRDAIAEPQGPSLPALFTADETAAYVRMSRRWVYRAVSAGEFPAPVKIGRATRWRRSDLDQWVENLGR